MSARADLGTLEASGLIEIAALQPELEYLFRHALVQDAAYSSLLKQDRRSLHRAAAETILALHPGRERELAAVVAMHFEQAGDSERAAAHLVVAGEQALERFANLEAVSFFRRAGALADTADVNLRLRAAIGAAKSGWTFVDSSQNIEQLDHVLEGAESGDQRLLAEAYFWAAFLRRQSGEVPETSPNLQHALDRVSEIGGQLNDTASAALPKALMGSYRAFTGKLREGAQDMSEALADIEATGDAVSIAMVSDFLALAYARLGEFAAAERTIELGLRHAGIGDEIARVDVQLAQAGLDLERGELAKASAMASDCASRAEDLGAYACVVASSVMFGAASLARDDAKAAKSPLERGDELSRVTGMAPMRTLLMALLGSMRARLGDLPAGVADWNAALTNAQKMKDRYGEAQTLWGRGHTYARQATPDWVMALADLDRAIELFEEMDARPSLARALHDRAHVLRNIGRIADADRDQARSTQLGTELGLRDMPFA